MMLWSDCFGPERECNMELNIFMKKLKDSKEKLTLQQYRTLKGQALAGNVMAAEKGLTRLLGKGRKYAD